MNNFPFFPPKGVCGSLAQILVPYLIAPLPLRITTTLRLPGLDSRWKFYRTLGSCAGDRSLSLDPASGTKLTLRIMWWHYYLPAAKLLLYLFFLFIKKNQTKNVRTYLYHSNLYIYMHIIMNFISVSTFFMVMKSQLKQMSCPL